ncbi:MAG: hypothetical protein IID40_03160 [Planctomycetes bacterium]|nr:hypothetical protein [Planctomycetota bacterium]
MRRILQILTVLTIGLSTLALTSGCEDSFLSASARSGATTFLTGVLNGAINGS